MTTAARLRLAAVRQKGGRGRIIVPRAYEESGKFCYPSSPMPWNERFFRRFWPVAGPAITAHTYESDREVESILRLLRLRPRARILDVPCGYGRHAVELARRGFQVTGVDISPKLLAQAREAARTRGVAAEFRRGDMRRLRYRQRFDAVLNLFTSFGYFGDREDLEVLKGFRRALRPGGGCCCICRIAIACCGSFARVAERGWANTAWA